MGGTVQKGTRLLGYVCGALIAAMAVLMSIQVIGRFVFQHPPEWTEELARVAFVYATFLGGALAVSRGAHLGIDILADALPPRASAILDVLWRLLACVPAAADHLARLSAGRPPVDAAAQLDPAVQGLDVRGRADRVRPDAGVRGAAHRDPGPRAAEGRGLRRLRHAHRPAVRLRPGPPGMTILFVVFLLLMLIGANIFYAMVAASVAYLIASTYSTFPVPMTLVPQQLMAGVDSFTLLAVPMFLLAGELMSRGGLTKRLIHFATVLVAHIRGGLAQVAVLSNMVMAGMSGSAVADLAATGSVLFPSMVRKGYRRTSSGPCSPPRRRSGR